MRRVVVVLRFAGAPVLIEETSWADEFKRILKLFKGTLKNGESNGRRSERTR